MMNTKKVLKGIKILECIKFWVCELPMILICCVGILIMLTIKEPRTRELTKEYMASYGLIAVALEGLLSLVIYKLKSKLKGHD